MSDSKNHINEEWISAYLDGELDATDRERVDRLLAENPRYQRMLDELHALRDTLKGLPEHKLGPNFQHKVLQQLESRKIGGAATAAINEAIPPSPETQAETKVSRPVRTWHNAVWAVAAVAAGLALLLLAPPRASREPTIAQRPDSPGDDAATMKSDRQVAREPVSDAKDLVRSGKTEESADGATGRRKESRSRAIVREVQSPTMDDAASARSGGENRAGDKQFSYQADEPSLRPMPDQAANRRVQPDGRMPDIDAAESRPAAGAVVGKVLRGRDDTSRTSSDPISMAIRELNATFVVHVALAQADEGKQLFDQSLGGQRVLYEAIRSPRANQETNEEIAQKLEGADRFGAKEALGDRPAGATAYRFLGSHEASRDSGSESRLVVVESTTGQLYGTVDQLMHLREQFPRLDVYQVTGNEASPQERIEATEFGHFLGGEQRQAEQRQAKQRQDGRGRLAASESEELTRRRGFAGQAAASESAAKKVPMESSAGRRFMAEPVPPQSGVSQPRPAAGDVPGPPDERVVTGLRRETGSQADEELAELPEDGPPARGVRLEEPKNAAGLSPARPSLQEGRMPTRRPTSQDPALGISLETDQTGSPTDRAEQLDALATTPDNRRLYLRRVEPSNADRSALAYAPSRGGASKSSTAGPPIRVLFVLSPQSSLASLPLGESSIQIIGAGSAERSAETIDDR